MTGMTKRSVLAVTLVVLGACRGAGAGIITVYTDQPSFDAATGVPMTVEDFTNTVHFPITTGTLNSETNLVVVVGPPITPGLIQPGVTYSNPSASAMSSTSTRVRASAGVSWTTSPAAPAPARR